MSTKSNNKIYGKGQQLVTKYPRREKVTTPPPEPTTMKTKGKTTKKSFRFDFSETSSSSSLEFGQALESPRNVNLDLGRDVVDGDGWGEDYIDPGTQSDDNNFETRVPTSSRKDCKFNWNLDRPTRSLEQWDVMIKVNTSAKDLGGYYYPQPGQPQPEISEEVVELEINDKGFQLLKYFQREISGALASGEIAESDLNSNDTLKAFLARAAGRVGETAAVVDSDSSDSEILEEINFFEVDDDDDYGFQLLFQMPTMTIHSLVYEFGQIDFSSDTAQPAEMVQAKKTLEMINGYSSEVYSSVLKDLIDECVGLPELKMIHNYYGGNLFSSKSALPIPGHPAELWPGIRVTPILENNSRCLFKIGCSYELFELAPLIVALNHCKGQEQGLKPLRSFCKQLAYQTVYCKHRGSVFRIVKVHYKASRRNIGLTTASVALNFSQEFGIPIEEIYAKQPLLECKPIETLNGPPSGSTFLLPQYCNLVGAASLSNIALAMIDGNFYKDVLKASKGCKEIAEDMIREFMEEFRTSSQVEAKLASWGMKFVGEAAWESSNGVPENETSSPALPLEEEEEPFEKFWKTAPGAFEYVRL